MLKGLIPFTPIRLQIPDRSDTEQQGATLKPVHCLLTSQPMAKQVTSGTADPACQ